jgi:hypothetical protein
LAEGDAPGQVIAGQLIQDWLNSTFS